MGKPASLSLPASVTLLTPTYAGDLARFSLQRESIERCGIELPHVAIVQHEDLSRFRDIPHQRGLTLISSRDVLPRHIERRRIAWGLRRRDPRRWFAGPPIHGWATQQFIKLASPAVILAEGIVCLDSDLVFIRPTTAADFYAVDGKLHLYETFDDVDAEMAEWTGRSMKFLGVKATHKPVSRFTHSPVPFHRQVLLDLQKHIEKRHGRHWIDAILRFGMVMEYSTYGVYAKYVDELTRVTPTAPPLSVYFWWPEEAAEIERTFDSRVSDSGAKIVAVQSNNGMQPAMYRALIERTWNGNVHSR
jgi:hypothetical protein